MSYGRFAAYVIGFALVGGVTVRLSTMGLAQVPPQPAQGGAAQAPRRPNRDISKWPYAQQQIYLSGQRGADWLLRHNGPDGRFVPGVVPALRVRLEEDNYLRQAGACWSFARAAKYYEDDKAAAIARQVILTLLVDTELEEPKAQGIRAPTIPAGQANPLSAAALLIQSIHDLPSAAGDLLEQSDQLCNFIRRRQRADGALLAAPAGVDAKAAAVHNEGDDVHAVFAICALLRSHQQRPADWKLDVARKGLTHYQAKWRANKSLDLACQLNVACAEAYLLTGSKPLEEFVFEISDWLCEFQYRQVDPRQPAGVGGFMDCVKGKPVNTTPNVFSAICAESLVQASRVARKAPDVQRWEKYKGTVERCLQFLTTLQYTDANTQHFAEWYRPVVLGAFHASHQDGNVRLDYNQHALAAMVGYLTFVAQVP